MVCSQDMTELKGNLKYMSNFSEKKQNISAFAMSNHELPAIESFPNVTEATGNVMIFTFDSLTLFNKGRMSRSNTEMDFLSVR